MDNLELFEQAATTVALTENELVAKLEAAEAAYYNGMALMEDAEYDLLRDELTALNPNHPHLEKVGAPIEVASDSSKVKHTIPMGSQRKAMNRGEFDQWLASVSKALGVSINELELQLSYKADGGSYSFKFVNGAMVECLSRGDGLEGEDVTANASMFQGIPHTVIDPTNGEPFNGLIRAEVVLPVDAWKALDPELTSNPRNIGNGIAGRSSGVDSDKLRVIAFRAYTNTGEELCNDEALMAQLMEHMGFETVPSMTGTSEQVWKFFKEIEAHRKDGTLDLDYWIDGGVCKLNSIEDQHEVGVSDNRPKGQIALKFEATGTPSVLEGVTITVGHTGMITPTGDFKPVQISGTTISSALLVNWDSINQLDIAIGDSVLLHKAGEIIPKVLRVTNRPDSRQLIAEPTCCPVCSGEVGKKKNVGGGESAHLFCLNPECSAKSSGKIGRFVKSVNILGIGDEVLEAMIEAGLVSNIADLYRLNERRAEFANLMLGESSVRFGESRADKVLAEIDKTRVLTIPQLLGSLGINHLGKRRVEIIMKSVPGQFDSLESWFDGSLVKYATQASIPNMAKAILDALSAAKPVIEDMLTIGVSIKHEAIKEVAADALSFCMTGKLSQSKKVYEQMVKDAGHEWKSSVAKGLNYLVMADPESTSSKAVKARKLGVKCISEEQLTELLKG